jgi:DNA-binding transcriptional ArsR family regulator
MSLAVISDTPGRQSYELDRLWFDGARTSASPELLAGIDAFSGSDRFWAHLISLAFRSSSPRDVPSFLGDLETTDPMEIRLHLLGYNVRYLRRLTPPDVVAAAAAGDPDAQQTFLRTSNSADQGWQSVLRAVLPLDAESTKRRVLEILREWYDQIFRAQESAIMPILERDAESKQALTRTLSPEKVMQAALPGYDYLPEPGLRQVTLIPTFVARPHIHSLDHADGKIFIYGVADDSIAVESDAPNPWLLRLTQALGDERRLRILKRLATGDATLHELATYFDVNDTTMLHHVIILRAAGLLRVQGGAGKRYQLERHMLPEMGNLLQTYLAVGEDQSNAKEVE